MNKFILVAISLFAISGCSSDADVVDQADAGLRHKGAAIERCKDGSGTKHYPCSASIYEISGSPDDYNGKYVETVVYYPGGGAVTVFFNRDSADSHDMFSSLLMMNQVDADGGYILVSGEFHYDKSDQGSMSYRQFGLINDVSVIRRMGSLAHTLSTCSKEKCRMDYSKSGGIHPELVRE